MNLLLHDEDTYETFFSYNFEHHSMHVDDSYRSDRSKWMKIHRRFIPNHDIDKLLNTSSQMLPFSISADVQLTRFNSGKFVREYLAPGKAPALPTLQSYFKEGFELILNRMHLRSSGVARFADSLSSFWHVRVESSLHFCPPSSSMKHSSDPLAATLRAGETFVVVLDDELAAYVHEDVQSFPLLDDLATDAHSILSRVRNPSPRTFALDEGDMLYVPRGSAFNIVARNTPALYISFHVRTDELPASSVLQSISRAAQKRSEGPLDQFATPQLPWTDVVSCTIRLAHELISPLRRFLPLSGGISEALEDAGKPTGQEVAVDVLQKFVVAAVDALFDPFIEAVAQKEIDVDDALFSWANDLFIRKESSVTYGQAKEMFKLCMDWLGRQSDAPNDGVSQLILTWFSELEERRRIEYKERISAFSIQGIQEDAEDDLI
ncbi:hypothetical protein BWQ96_04821 [Gracilariopsis chorda]|uniref:Uncharacterized protein n=1 Tax=Gracilariopsis chorda TaxID=448386 RepID=A0A2V3ITF6_9FLOR|nr:hypothetical protein BWQ96_04821 [Gracilariopsis chorda]|eukprot:PXF45406.1 hypothetical protein BWQ96_04821 [Gracilariopsis chorda]